jgi:atypical dual specificity phosphatase
MAGIDVRTFAGAGDVLLRPSENCYWLIAGRLLAGEYPGADDAGRCSERLDAMLDRGIRHFVDLTMESEPLVPYVEVLRERAAARAAMITHRRFPIADFGVPSVAGMRATLEAIDAALETGAGTYLHCRGGIGRTATVAGCLLVQHGFTGDGALALIDRKWRVMAKSDAASRSPETRAQRDFIAQWHR